MGANIEVGVCGEARQGGELWERVLIVNIPS